MKRKKCGEVIAQRMDIGPKLSDLFFGFFNLDKWKQLRIITKNLRVSYSISLFFRKKVHDPVYYEIQDLTAESFTMFWNIEVALVSLPLTLNIFLSLSWYFYCWLWTGQSHHWMTPEWFLKGLLNDSWQILRFKASSNTKIWFSGCIFEHGLLNYRLKISVNTYQPSFAIVYQ